MYSQLVLNHRFYCTSSKIYMHNSLLVWLFSNGNHKSDDERGIGPLRHPEFPGGHPSIQELTTIHAVSR